jgi:soluble lytic murein transglycosylase
MLAASGALLAAGCGNAAADPPGPSVLPAFTVMQTEDSTMRRAGAALEAGRPWEATRLLAPLLRDSTRRTPAVLLRAADAASGWGGWTEVIELLANEPWLGRQFEGRGHFLVARAALSIVPRTARTDSLALRHARAALAVPSGVAEQGARETMVARSHDRLRSADSARAHYLHAATLLPEARDWLVLRGARLTEDDRSRQRDYESVRGSAARDRRDWTEADARELAGDFQGAAAIHERIGSHVQAFRLRFAAADDTLQRAAIRRELLAFVASSPGALDARAAVDLLDARTTVRAPAEELVIARSAAKWGPPQRAVAAYAVALGAGLGDDRDRYAYGDALFRVGRESEAAVQFARVSPASPLAGVAAYQRARSLLRSGSAAAARAALTRTVTTFPRDTTGSGSALYLLGDLASDGGRDDEARRYFLQLARSYPTSQFTPQARLRASMIALVAGRARQAALELDSIAAAYPQHAEASAALYWAGRSWRAAGADGDARTRWRAVVDRNGASYYAMLAARAMGEPVWTPAPAPDSVLRRVPDIDSAMTRARLLEQLGMDDEARFEDERLFREATSSIDRMIATAQGFSRRGNASRAIALARRALDSGAAPTTEVFRLLYPVTQEGVLLAESASQRLDPALVAALIRQESNFTPRATSAAGARGLMQVMPSVGAALARSLGFPRWDPVLLYQPDVNVQLGVRHLAGAIRRYSHPAYALAAYNAGDSRARRWSAKPGGNDPELFVERIPFTETRDYVRIILRNRELYRALYRWPGQ